MIDQTNSVSKKPSWLQVKLPIGKEYTRSERLLANISFILFVRVVIVLTWENAGEQVQPPL